MQFKRVNQWVSASDEGYCVSAARVNGNYMFTAWPPNSKTGKQKQPTAIKYSKTAQECYQACEQHHQKKQENQK